MKIDKVTDAFAFVLANGEFTESILFSETEIEQLKPDERNAADLVLKHVESCYVELLSCCRQTFLVRAKASPLEANRRTLEVNKSRPRTVWGRAMMQVPLLIRNSWVAWVSFGLWSSTNAGRPIMLAARITTQRKFFGDLQEAVKSCGSDFSAAGASAHAVEPLLPKEGDRFDDLADEIVGRALPIASAVYARINT